MSTDATSPQIRDIASVGTRVSWGAIWAGGILALALVLLMSTLAGAVGLAIGDRVNPANLQMGSFIWALLTAAIALFVGGMLTSLLTVGENKTEAVMHGILMWALLLAIIVFLGAMGVRGLSLYSTGISIRTDSAGNTTELRVETPRDTPAKAGNEAATTAEISAEQARRLGWFSFATIWLSMLAAAAGAYAGAGPTFRVVGVSARTITARTSA